ncbi:MAG: hypothetical protein ACK4TG_11810 [Thermaurantiacus sp.]
MQRLRTGLVGLGMVFLMTFAASLLVGAAGGPRPMSISGEPLAMLGVAPSFEPVAPRLPVASVTRSTAGAHPEQPERVTI